MFSRHSKTPLAPTVVSIARIRRSAGTQLASVVATARQPTVSNPAPGGNSDARLASGVVDKTAQNLRFVEPALRQIKAAA